MTIVILAAGKGERLWPLTKNTPKPLLDLGNGSTLLEEQLERIKSSSVIDRVVVVVGYLAEQIESKVKLFGRTLPVTFIYNPFYEVSNNLVSLWMARHELIGDAMITNGDNLIQPDVFMDLAQQNTRPGVYVTLVRKSVFSEDDMKVTLDLDAVTEIGKNIPLESAHAESIGLILLRGARYSSLLVEHLEALVRQPPYLGAFWLEAFNSMQRKGLAIQAWFTEEQKWQEVDFHLDIANARALLSEKLDMLTPAGVAY